MGSGVGSGGLARSGKADSEIFTNAVGDVSPV